MHHCRVCNYLCDCDGSDQRAEQPDNCQHLQEAHKAVEKEGEEEPNP